MAHDTILVTTIVVSLVLAFIGGFAASKLKLPPLVGYMAAGVVVGPFTPGFVGDATLTGQLAEIGVILLMFGVGLHFSITDLLAVRKIAIPVALAQMVVATALGVAMGHFWGWPLGTGLVLGLALSVASTVVALRALEQRSTLDSINGRIAVGALIVQDLVMVLVLVLLPALAEPLGGHAEGTATGSIWKALAVTAGEVALFLVLVLVVGKRVVPWVLEHTARTGSRELFTLGVLVTALGIAYGSAALFSVSFALGAFFAGVVLSETDFSHQAGADSLPLQDAFAVLFFVSVGMLFDPSILLRQPAAVATVVLIIIAGKSLASIGTVLLFRYPASTALTISASLAQIGEFSFILAGLGTTLGLLPKEGSDLILAGALVSITLNPLVFGAFGRVKHWLYAHPKFLTRLERNAADLSALASTGADDGPSGHAVIVGYGRVGSIIGKALKDQGLTIVIVEQDRRRVEALRARGLSAVYGDASTPGVLKAAYADRAHLMVVATPDGFQTRRIIELGRELNHALDIAVRTHSDREVAYLEQQGVGFAIMGEREMAFSLMDYALRSLGTPEDKARHIIQKMRVAGDGGAFERRDTELPRRAPELRLHRDAETP